MGNTRRGRYNAQSVALTQARSLSFIFSHRRQSTWHSLAGSSWYQWSALNQGQKDSFHFTFYLGQTALQQLRQFNWVHLSFFFFLLSFLPSPLPSSFPFQSPFSLVSCFPLISVAQDQDLATTVSAFHNAVAKDLTILAPGPVLFLPQSPSLLSPTFVRHFGICRGFSFAQRAKC